MLRYTVRPTVLLDRVDVAQARAVTPDGVAGGTHLAKDIDCSFGV
jgi:hypothetical protein